MNAKQRHQHRIEEEKRLAKEKEEAIAKIQVERERVARIEQQQAEARREEAIEELPKARSKVFELSDRAIELEKETVAAAWNAIDSILALDRGLSEFEAARSKYDEVSSMAGDHEVVDDPALELKRPSPDCDDRYASHHIEYLLSKIRSGSIKRQS